MYIKQLFTNGKLGKSYIVILVCLYILSFLACTVSFFTPYWLHGVVSYRLWNNFPIPRTCDTLGLVSGDCRFPFSKTDTSAFFTAGDYTHSLARLMQGTFYSVLGTMCILFTNLVLTVLAFTLKLFENRIFMSFLSVSYGVLYPIGALLVLVPSIIVEVEYTSDVGFSVILATISGGLMLLFYAGLRLYNDQYIQHIRMLQKDTSNLKDDSILSNKTGSVSFTKHHFKLQ